MSNFGCLSGRAGGSLKDGADRIKRPRFVPRKDPIPLGIVHGSPKRRLARAVPSVAGRRSGPPREAFVFAAQRRPLPFGTCGPPLRKSRTLREGVTPDPVMWVVSVLVTRSGKL